MALDYFIEKEIISKRLIIAVLVICLFSLGHIGEGILGAVVGYYFGSHQVDKV